MKIELDLTQNQLDILKELVSNKLNKTEDDSYYDIKLILDQLKSGMDYIIELSEEYNLYDD